MAGRAFYPARFEGGFPVINVYEAKAAQDFKAGTPVKFDAGQVVEVGASDVLTVGIALNDAFTGAGYDAGDSPTVITGRTNGVSVALAGPDTIFSCRGVNGGTDPVIPTLAHVGEDYGVLEDADGIWTIDIADTTNVIAKVVDVDIDNKIFFVRLYAV